ncbi:hypothetical protein BLOT_009439, partial [Blomia tropicalis]
NGTKQIGIGIHNKTIIEYMNGIDTTQTKCPFTSSSSFDDNGNHKDECTIKAKPFNTIPGPWPSLPLIGTQWQYFSFVGGYDVFHLHEAYRDRYHKYGNIVRETFRGGQSLIHIYDPNDFEIVFRSTRTNPMRPPNEFVSMLRTSRSDRYPNIGFPNMNGPEWWSERRKVAPAMNKMRTIQELMDGQNQICTDFLEYLWSIRDADSGLIDDLHSILSKLSLEAIGFMCLDSRMHSFPYGKDDDSSDVADGVKLIEAANLLFSSFNRLFYGIPIWKFIPTEAYRDLMKAESTLFEIAEKYVNREIEQHESEMFVSSNSVLKTLLQSPDLNRNEVKVAIVDLIAGGIFTVTNAMVFLMYTLAANPDAQEKLYQEIVSIIGDNSSEYLVRYADISRMTYLKACVTESFRMNGPIPGVFRITTEPIVLSGYQIPSNTPIFIHSMTTCKTEKYFPDADQYKPERWLNEDAKPHPYALLPFGFGSRVCIGKRFAENQINLAIIRIIQEYRLELAPGLPKQIDLLHSFLMIPAYKISMRIIRR